MSSSKVIYLDHAAATPMDSEVLISMQPYMTERFYNPSATYLAAQAVAKDIENARREIAHWLGARPSEVIFTAGGTEANNLAIHGIMQQYPDGHLVVSAIEHESVLAPAQSYDYTTVSVGIDGLLGVRSLEKIIQDQTVLISIMYANNEIGTVQPLSEISHLIKQVRQERVLSGNNRPLYLHTDACQAANYLHLYAKTMGVDLLTLNAGKIYGPKQCGALFVRGGVILKPLIHGGGQEYGLRSGTENVANIIGFGAALKKAQLMRDGEISRLAELQRLFLGSLTTQVPAARINGSQSQRLPNNVHVTFPGLDNERIMMALDGAGIQCAVGSACSASSDEPSHVLQAIGLTDAEARASLRFTMGRSTTKSDIQQTIKALTQLIH